MHGSTWRREETGTSRHSRAEPGASRRPDRLVTDTLASMTKHSCRPLADLGLTPDTGTRPLLREARRAQRLAVIGKGTVAPDPAFAAVAEHADRRRDLDSAASSPAFQAADGADAASGRRGDRAVSAASRALDLLGPAPGHLGGCSRVELRGQRRECLGRGSHAPRRRLPAVATAHARLELRLPVCPISVAGLGRPGERPLGERCV